MFGDLVATKHALLGIWPGERVEVKVPLAGVHIVFGVGASMPDQVDLRGRGGEGDPRRMRLGTERY